MFIDYITPTWVRISLLVLLVLLFIYLFLITVLASQFVARLTPKKLHPLILSEDYLQEFDMSAWQGIKLFDLGSAACLWEEVLPHNPIKHEKAANRFALLSNAVRSGQLKVYESLEAELKRAFLLDGNRLVDKPSCDTPVTAIALRRYAEHIGNIPRFLEQVRLLPEEPPQDNK